ncbi:TPA: hypothetical protein MNC23_005510 [Citrobacter freundii]|uniref:hypothetical protein n=1 Tax=Citrobacter freundii complex TaxID=1344959 RepID=UPI0008F8BB66|nr:MULTISPECIES: hypothetical protein [Citrobacter freundii complex]EJY4260745.1 hypothetical protein [Escherichia coli]MCO5631433.1 hypothetical protein [Citrobacter freundii]MCO5636864.1 hypothetical protein [Citrobacter freundii]MCO5641777.1 hypothetical protein [Citrobacter freundii]MDE9576085.1 hypothetical protein [Citrobacter portucalensis]
MEYIIGKGVSVFTLDGNEIDQNNIDLALFTLTGFTPINTNGVTVWERGSERYWTPPDTQIEDADSISEHLNAKVMVPSQDASFAQRLLRLVPMVVNPIVFIEGRLVGGWQVENNPEPSTGDIMTNGHQSHSYQDTVLPMAIAMVFLQVQGLGQQAWVYIGEHDAAQPELHYVVPHPRTLALLESTPAFIRAPELDKFAVVGPSPDLIQEAFTTAKLKQAALVPE